MICGLICVVGTKTASARGGARLTPPPLPWDDDAVTESPSTSEVRIQDESIKLGQFLKLADLVDSGHAAKPLLAAGMVRVNDAVETRRGRQLVPGDVVTVAQRSVRVAG